MMWNYLMSGLMVGATIVLFDGDPRVPRPGTLWRSPRRRGVGVFGVSAPFLMSCRKAGSCTASPPPEHRLHRRAAPTGRVRWVRDVVGTDVQTAR